ncbi:hypothetical protein ACIBBE_02015 [Streptomyces sp. NPDC051644]|uniref:hypothetical protein n=1 Tax=Streptomyces sp. NPDC051644 TaxID=3365666 RepID=UPI00379DE777
MQEFLSAATAFPAVLFGAALAVVVFFWLLVLAGAADHHSFDGDLDTGMAGIGGVPVTVSVSVTVVVGWFTSLAGTVLLRRSGVTGLTRAALACAVFAGALLIARAVMRVLVRLVRRRFPDEPPPSRQDFLGRVCTIRTGSVSSDFGQAEVAAADGSTAIVQVRLLGPTDDAHGTDGTVLTSGSAGLLYAYDDEGEFFWVSPYDKALDPGPPKPRMGPRPGTRSGARRTPRRSG